MLDEKIFATFEKLLGVESERIDRAMTDDLMHIAADASRRGMLNSSAAALQGVKKVADTLPIRAEVAMSLFLRCASAANIKFDQESADDFLVRLSTWFDTEIQRLQGILKASTVFSRRIVNENNEAAFLKYLHDTARMTKTKTEGQVELLVLQNQSQSRDGEKQNGPNINVTGNIGSLHTGDYSSANVIQNIDTGTSERILEALENIANELAASGDDNTDLCEVVEEAKLELKKEKPNTTKLVGLLKGVGGAIGFIPKFQDAYNTLKWAAAGLGL